MVHPLRDPADLVGPAHVGQRLPCPLISLVRARRDHEQRPRRSRPVEVRRAHPPRQRREHVLLRVPRAHHPHPARRADRDRHLHPLLQRRDEPRQRPPARTPRAPDPLRVHVPPLYQQVNPPHPIPDEVHRQMAPRQKDRVARHGVLIHHVRPQQRCPQQRVVVHQPLPLPRRVVDQRDAPAPGQPGAQRLIVLIGLARVPVPDRTDHPRKRPCPFGPVEIRRHVEPGLRLVDQLFYRVAVLRHAPGLPDVQRRPLRERPQDVPVDPPCLRLPRGQRLRRGDPPQPALPRLVAPLRDPADIVREHRRPGLCHIGLLYAAM